MLRAPAGSAATGTRTNRWLHLLNHDGHVLDGGHGQPRPVHARALLVRSLDWYRARPADLQVTLGMRRALVEAQYLAGRWEEARQSLIALALERPDDVAVQGRLGTLAARQGNRAEAERILAWLTALDRPYLLGEHTYWRARIAALLGERERAVAWLQEAHAQGRSEWIGLHSDPDLESLHDFTPFRRLVRPKG